MTGTGCGCRWRGSGRETYGEGPAERCLPVGETCPLQAFFSKVQSSQISMVNFSGGNCDGKRRAV